MPSEKQTAVIPLAYGLETGSDSRALRAPDFSICQNVEFEETSGMQTRKPFGNMSENIVGGGVIANPRRLVVNGDELLLFTKTAIYAYSAIDSAWVFRADHLATTVTEESAFATTKDQIFADRAELNGVAVITWLEGAVGAVAGYITAVDVATGAVTVPPTLLPVNTSGRVRVIAMATRILLIYSIGSSASAFAIDPANAAATIASGIAVPTSLTTGSTIGPWDAAYDAVGDRVYAVFARSVTYTIARITSAVAVTVASYARLASGCITIVAGTSGASLWVFRTGNASDLKADLIVTATMADGGSTDVSLGTPSGTTARQLTAAVRPVVAAGPDRFYLFWHSAENASGASSTFTCESNYIDQAGTAGTKVTIARRLAVASKAFVYESKVYVWLTFAGESTASGMSLQLGLRASLQNVYLLFSESATSHTAEPLAKAVSDKAGGFPAQQGFVPGVQVCADGQYRVAMIERRIIPLNSKQSNYASRTARLVALAFDALGGRRGARLGRTFYLSGGQIHQYDGVSPVEVGFHIAPYAWTAATLAGSLPAGSYNHVRTYSWVNAAQEKERSTTVAASSTTIAINQLIEFSASATPPLAATRKKNTRSAVSSEYWRSQVDPAVESPVHLVSSLDPTDASNPNRYITNDPSAAFEPAFQDDLIDADLIQRESYGENGNVLQSLVPPAATIVVATQDRVILAGLADDPNGWAYSKQRGADEVAAFNGLLRGSLPPDGGPITAAAFLAETLVLFKEHAIFAVPGDGFDNTGGGQNYGPGRLISSGVGAVSQEAVALTPRGLLFKSLRGWYLLTGWQEPTYIGKSVKAFDGDTVQDIVVIEGQHQVRIVTDQRVIVWDYEAYRERGGAWSEWTSTLLTDCLSSVIWRGEHVVLTETAILRQVDWGDPSITEVFGWDVELGWLVTAQWQRIWELMPDLEFRSACRVRVRLKRNGNDTTYFQDKTYTPTVAQAVAGARLQFRHRPSIIQSDSMKVRLTAVHASVDATPPAGESPKLTALAFLYGVEQGLFRLPSGQDQ